MYKVCTPSRKDGIKG